jgi:hypothetical protein
MPVGKRKGNVILLFMITEQGEKEGEANRQAILEKLVFVERKHLPVPPTRLLQYFYTGEQETSQR